MEEVAVRCLVIPLKGLLMLVPNTTVAEVTDFVEPMPLPNAPEWFRGMLPWRGRNIPMVDMLSVTGQGKDTQQAKRLVVFNTMNGNAELPFVAISAHGIPRLVEVKGEMVQPVDEDEQDEATGISCRVLLADRKVAIPDIDALERLLSQLSIKVG